MAECVQVLKLTGLPKAQKAFEQGIFVYHGQVNEKPCFSCAFKFPGHNDFQEYSLWWVSDPGVFILGPSATKGTGNGLMYVPGKDAVDPTRVSMQWIINDEAGDWKAAPEMRAVEAELPSSMPKPSVQPVHSGLSSIKTDNPREPAQAKSTASPALKTGGTSSEVALRDAFSKGSVISGRLPLTQLRTGATADKGNCVTPISGYPNGSLSARGSPSTGSKYANGSFAAGILSNASLAKAGSFLRSGSGSPRAGHAVLAAAAIGGYSRTYASPSPRRSPSNMGLARVGTPRAGVQYGAPVHKRRIAVA